MLLFSGSTTTVGNVTFTAKLYEKKFPTGEKRKSVCGSICIRLARLFKFFLFLFFFFLSKRYLFFRSFYRKKKAAKRINSTHNSNQPKKKSTYDKKKRDEKPVHCKMNNIIVNSGEHRQGKQEEELQTRKINLTKAGHFVHPNDGPFNHILARRFLLQEYQGGLLGCNIFRWLFTLDLTLSSSNHLFLYEGTE